MVLLSLIVNQDWSLLQFDVKNTFFLQGDLKVLSNSLEKLEISDIHVPT